VGVTRKAEGSGDNITGLIVGSKVLVNSASKEREAAMQALIEAAEGSPISTSG
jgi:hypothetical protein